MQEKKKAFQCGSLQISNVVKDWNDSKAVRIHITNASNDDIIVDYSRHTNKAFYSVKYFTTLLLFVFTEEYIYK